MESRFILTFKRTNEIAFPTKVEAGRTQVQIIESVDAFFELARDVEIARLYRIDPKTGEISHVQTWVRSVVAV